VFEISVFRDWLKCLFVCSHDQLWDPVLADEAEKRGEDIEGFLAKGKGLAQKEMLMHLLHRTNYSVESAKWNLDRIFRWAGGMSSTDLSVEEAERFHLLLERRNTNKDFALLSREIGRGRSDCMVYYYRWKGQCPEAYRELKRVWKKKRLDMADRESLLYDPTDYCTVCDDGGELIVCDFCDNAYHLTCLKPPMETVPDGTWSCPKCVSSDARAKRAAFRSPEDRRQILSPNSLHATPSSSRSSIPIFQSPYVPPSRFSASPSSGLVNSQNHSHSPRQQSFPRDLFESTNQASSASGDSSRQSIPRTLPSPSLPVASGTAKKSPSHLLQHSLPPARCLASLRASNGTPNQPAGSQAHEETLEERALSL
jgi:hypothetical protein